MSRLSRVLFSLVFCELLFLFYLLVPAKIFASGVSMSATVVQRRPTDTINDFAFETINPSGQGKVYL